MRHVRLDVRDWQSARLRRLHEELGISAYEAIGILAVFWHVTREAGIEEATEEALAGMLVGSQADNERIILGLIHAGYLQQTQENEFRYLITDNAGMAEARQKRVEAAKAGVAGRARKRAAAPKKRAPRPKRDKPALVPPPTAPVWEAYAEAYERRWGHPPVRNARANALTKQLVTRLGSEASEHLVRFYVQHNEPFYLRNTHDLQYCVKNCDTLFTQMRRGEQITRKVVESAEKENHYVNLMQRISNGEL